jgi:hypothetical protein
VKEYRTVGREHGTFTDAVQGFVIYARCSRSDCRARDDETIDGVGDTEVGEVVV